MGRTLINPWSDKNTRSQLDEIQWNEIQASIPWIEGTGMQQNIPMLQHWYVSYIESLLSD
jgi:hypothetical protein